MYSDKCEYVAAQRHAEAMAAEDNTTRRENAYRLHMSWPPVDVPELDPVSTDTAGAPVYGADVWGEAR